MSTLFDQVAAGPTVVSPQQLGAAPQLSDAEVTEFAKAFEAAFAAGDLAGAEALIDKQAMVDRTLAGIEIDPKIAAGFGDGMRSGMGSLVREIGASGANGNYVFLRVRDVNGEKRPLFRLTPPDGGINYHELILTRGDDGAVKLADAFVYLSGETLTETMRRMVMPALAQLDKSWLQKLAQSDAAFMANYEKFGEMNRLRQAGQHAEWLAMYDKLPVEMQALKPIRIGRVMAAQQVNEQEYMKAMEEFRKGFPNDPSLLLMEIDYYYLRKQYDATRKTIEKLDTAVGGDPRLDSMLADLLAAAGEVPAAREVAENAVKKHPDHEDNHWLLVGVQLRQKDHAAVLAELKKMDQQFVVAWTDFTASESYADFVQSPEYQEWLAYLADKQGSAPAAE